MDRQRKAYLYALSAVLLWSTVASAFKISLRHVDVLSLLFLASVVSSVVLFAFLVFQKKVYLLGTYSARDYLRSAFLGFLNPFLYYAVLFKAYSLLAAQQAQAINFLWPIMLVLLSIPLLKQKITLKSIVAVFISFGGVFVISTQGKIFDFRFSSPAGVGLALGSTVIWALFWIYNLRDKRDETAKLFLSFGFGMVFVFVWLLVFGDLKAPGLKGVVGGVYVGLFEMGITFLVWLKALRVSRTTAHVANLIYLTPFFSLVVIYFAVGEEILISTVVGLVLIVGGIILQKL